MGTIKTTNIETITGSGTLTLGQSGETISIPSGATLDLSNATQTGVGESNTPAFSVRQTTNQTGISSDTLTKISFQAEDLDTDMLLRQINLQFLLVVLVNIIFQLLLEFDQPQFSN